MEWNEQTKGQHVHLSPSSYANFVPFFLPSYPLLWDITTRFIGDSKGKRNEGNEV